MNRDLRDREALRSGRVWQLLRASRRMWLRASAFAVASILGALLAPLLEPLIPTDLPGRLGVDAVGDILRILASSMLVVATFSLGTLISAFAVASTGTTPRVTELLMEDPRAQNAISVFVGAFLFALVGIIGLAARLYSSVGVVVLFAITLFVVGVVIVTFLRWVDLVSHLGRIPDAVDRSVDAALGALEDRLLRPHLGARPWSDDLEVVDRVEAGAMGHVRHVDLAALETLATRHELQLRVEVLPGDFIGVSEVVVSADARLEAQTRAQIRAAVDLGPRRTFELDPRYCVLALAEIGSKALSPGLNDPGTAINVVAGLTRVLGRVRDPVVAQAPSAERVSARSLAIADLVEDAFGALARDAAGLVQVQERMLKSLALLADGASPAFAQALLRAADRVRDHGLARLQVDSERARVEALHARVGQACVPRGGVSPA